MSATIYKINKDTLLEVTSSDIFVEDIKSVAIQHIHDNSVSDESTISFSINVANNYVPEIQEEMVVVIRERIDATSRGPYDQIINDVGDDVGEGGYTKKVAYRPWELPEGFKELKGQNE
jgi:hypothetical protein